MDTARWLHAARGLFAAALFPVLGAVALAPALAQDDPPGRVGRVAELHGRVSWFDDEQGRWVDAERNRPLTGGDRISTAPDARAELRVGSTVLRLGGRTELEVLRLDDEQLVFQLHTGALALRVRSREIADEVELATAEARFAPLRAGHYRIDRVDDTTLAGAWRGELRIVDQPGDATIASGERAELFRDRAGRLQRQPAARGLDDAFGAWVLADDDRDERSVALRHVSPEMTGAEELDRHGRWETHPEHGAIWIPVAVQPGWAPYRHGRWTWVSPWGWTWIDEAPWGFAPFHYGRWVHWRSHWCWVPGAYAPRPVYAPALVAWVGGSHGGVSVHIGGPAVGWVPLAPRELYHPLYRHTPRYGERVNPGPPQRWHPQDERGHRGPWGNQGVPGGVTVVPNDVLQRRAPVARAIVEPRPGSGAWTAQPPPGRPVEGRRDDRPGDRRDDRRPGPQWRETLPGSQVMPMPQQRDERRGRDDERWQRAPRAEQQQPAPAAVAPPAPVQLPRAVQPQVQPQRPQPIAQPQPRPDNRTERVREQREREQRGDDDRKRRPGDAQREHAR